MLSVFSLSSVVSNGFYGLIRILVVRMSNSLAPRVSSRLNHINAWVLSILPACLITGLILLIRLTLFLLIFPAILLSIARICLLSLSSIDLTLVKLGSGCCSINVFQDELTSETVILFWHIVLVDCVQVWEMVFTLLCTVQIVIQAHDSLNERLIIDWYTKNCRFESELIEQNVSLEQCCAEHHQVVIQWGH